MKEYIYLDTDLLNSTLAQVDEGLISGFSESNESGENSYKGSNETTSKGMEGILQVGARYVKEMSNESSVELTQSQSKALDYVLNDYAVDLLLERITGYDNFSSEISDAEEGYIVNFSGPFYLYDFQMIERITKPENINLLFEENDNKDIEKIKKQLPLLRKQQKNNPKAKKELRALEAQIKEVETKQNNSRNTFDILHKASVFADNILGGSIFIKSNQSLSLCKRDCFRLSQGQLAMLTETNRKINVLAIVSSIKERTHKDGKFDELKTHELNKIPSMFSDLFLSNFNMINEGDRILTPIALFFE